MNKLLTLLLFAATSAGAQVELNPLQITWLLATNGGVEYFPHSVRLDCEPYETFTPWQARSEGNDGKFIHKHEWVYAEREDVNPTSGITNAVYCPCGCPTTENQARICSACFRHEWRTRECGQRPKEKMKSKYLQIVEKTPKNNVVINLGPGAGDGELRFHETDGGSVFVGIATGKNPKANSVVFSITSDAKAMTISGSDGIEGETFRKDATKFYVSKTSDGYAVKSIGALPEYSVYAIKITFD